MRGGRSIGAVLALLGAAVAGSAAAELAAPGPCAEPRTGTQEEPVAPFDVGGGPRQHFDPLEVGAPPGDGPGTFDRPDPPSFSRTPCDAPNTACIGATSVPGGPGGGSGGGTVIVSPPVDTGSGRPPFGGQP